MKLWLISVLDTAYLIDSMLILYMINKLIHLSETLKFQEREIKNAPHLLFVWLLLLLVPFVLPSLLGLHPRGYVLNKLVGRSNALCMDFSWPYWSRSCHHWGYLPSIIGCIHFGISELSCERNWHFPQSHFIYGLLVFTHTCVTARLNSAVDSSIPILFLEITTLAPRVSFHTHPAHPSLLLIF